jgi:hypothetical protein
VTGVPELLRRGVMVTEVPKIESWRDTWRKGFAPLMTAAELTALRGALADDDPRLTQGSTTSPPPLMCVQDWVAEAACFLGYCGALRHGGWGEATVGECEAEFARLCFDADQRIGEPAACRWYLNWFDDTPRDEMRREMVAEIDSELSRRASGS